jgi:hypothetical protein
LRRLAAVRKFFTTCPFVEDEETRKVLLGQLDEISEKWKGLDTESILSSYDAVPDK